MEKEFATHQGQIIQALVYGLIFLVLLTTGLLLFFYFSRKKLLQKELEKKSLELAHQQQVLQAAITAQEEERSRIAQDLHDAVSARLNVISLTAHVLIDDPGTDPEQKNSLQHILDVTGSTLESSRKIAHGLMPAILDKFGLKAALEELFEAFTKSKSIRIDHSIDDLPRLGKSGELHVFRIVQELINNSVRHGKADVLSLHIAPQASGFVFNYHDNGIGFNPEASKKSPGIGLQNIKTRVAILNGALLIKSAPDQGSTFIINIPSHE